MASKKTTPTDTAEAKAKAPRKKNPQAKPAVQATAAKKRATPRKPKPTGEPKATTGTTRPAAERATPTRAEPTHEQIAARAAEIWREHGGTPFENWIAAERELAR